MEYIISIKNWFRRFSKKDKTNWDKLNELINAAPGYLTEQKFEEFVRATILKNPSAVYLEDGSPLETSLE
ncbi:MAG: SinI family restriction endonuclease [Bacteroidia bacterium]|nr:SinI family restriction endonuclease [Bacteroidia bacterium]